MAKDTREYSVRMLEKARANSTESLDISPVFMPVGRIKPETFNDALNRILATSASQGMSLQEAYESIQGDFDGDDDDFEGFDDEPDDEFEQSGLASYELEPNATQAEGASVGRNEPAKEPEPVQSKEPESETARDSEQA